MTKKRFLLALALMLTAVGGAWAQGHQKYTSAVNLSVLQTGDTLAEGASINYNLCSSCMDNYLHVAANRAKANGDLITYPYGQSISTSITVGAEGAIVDGTSTYTPVTADNQDGNAWVVNLDFDAGADFYDVTLSGITMPVAAPLLVKDNDTLWHLTTPAGNVTLSVTYYGQYRLDSIPQGWEVKVNGTLMGSDTLKTYTEGGNPQMRYIAAINETDSVELIPPAELRETIKAVRLTESVAAPAVVEPITVTWNKSDITGTSPDSFTKDGVTVYSERVDAYGDDERTSIRNSSESTGTFTTTLGNFTKIEVTAMNNISGTGWSGNSSKMTWEGEASSSVSFQGYIMGYSGITIVFTIQPNN